MALAKPAKSSSSSKKSNQNYSTSLASGGSVTVKNGVKTYSDKPLQVNGKNGISISGKDYSVNKGGSGFAPVITPDSLSSTPVLTPPSKPTVADPGNLVGTGNNQVASLISGLGYTQDQKGMFVPPAANTAEAATAASNATMAQQLQSLLGLKQQDESQADIYAKEYKAQGIERAQKEVNNVTNQINQVTANRDAAILSLEGQGRGQTSGFIGGEQARINREAAIQALPLQAQLSAAQGNLEFAQQQLNTMFSLKVADSQAKTKFWNGLVDTALNFATTAQQNILTAKLADINTNAQKEQANLALMNQWAMTAVETGQSGLISQFTALDPKSPTFTADLGRLQAKVQKPVAATSTKRDTQVVDGKLIDMQTGEVINDFAGANTQQQEQLNETLTLARELLDDNTAGKSGAIGFGFQKFVPFGQSLGLQGDRTSFENKVNTLKANLTLDNLKLLKGPMSDKDLAFLQAIGSSITPNMSEKAFNAEVTRVINKLEEKVAPVSLTGGKVITAPDGQQVEIID